MRVAVVVVAPTASAVKVEANISISRDGYATGPNLDRYPGLCEGGDVTQAWIEESRAMDCAAVRREVHVASCRADT